MTFSDKHLSQLNQTRTNRCNMISNDLKFIKLIKQLLIITSVVLFIYGIYHGRSAFRDGWKLSDNPDYENSLFHVSVRHATIMQRTDSLHIKGNDGFVYNLERKDLVSGDVFNRNKLDKMVSFYQGIDLILIISILTAVVLIFVKLYHFLNDSSKGEIFTLENIQRIKNIGIYCISLSILFLMWDFLNFKIQEGLFRHTNYRVDYEFDFNYVLFTVGMVTMVIMYVFKKGYQLKQEQELTV